MLDPPSPPIPPNPPNPACLITGDACLVNSFICVPGLEGSTLFSSADSGFLVSTLAEILSGMRINFRKLSKKTFRREYVTFSIISEGLEGRVRAEGHYSG